MSLSPGSRLGAYEIVAALGAGGMGEVYRARDSKLKREVAIKVLPDAFATDPQALARFEREALAVAALSHPNILSIHDFGSEGGVAYAVMELLEGETLRAKLETGPPPEKLAVDYALQIAKGLSAAHQKEFTRLKVLNASRIASTDRRGPSLSFLWRGSSPSLVRVEEVEPGIDEVVPAEVAHGFRQLDPVELPRPRVLEGHAARATRRDGRYTSSRSTPGIPRMKSAP